LYAAGAARLIAVSSDAVDATHPLVSGELQQQTASSFDNSSISGRSVVWLAGFDPGIGAPTVSIGLVTVSSPGSYSLVLDTNQAGTLSSAQTSSGTYSVDASGRTGVASSGAGTTTVLYLVGPNVAIALDTDKAASLGRLQAQTATQLDGSALMGNTFYYGTEGPHAASRMIASGAIAFESNFTDQGHQDESTPSGLVPAAPFGPTMFNFPANSPALGRGTLNNSGGELAYIVSDTMLVYLNTGAVKPRVVIVER
jgi:hypothetical protein